MVYVFHYSKSGFCSVSLVVASFIEFSNCEASFCNGIPFRLFPCGFTFATLKNLAFSLGSSEKVWGFVLLFDESKLISKVPKSILSQETNGRRSKHTFRFQQGSCRRIGERRSRGPENECRHQCTSCTLKSSTFINSFIIIWLSSRFSLFPLWFTQWSTITKECQNRG